MALAKQVQDLRSWESRVKGIDQTRALFEQDTAQLVKSCAPELRDADAETSADRLATALNAAEAAQAVRTRNSELLSESIQEREKFATLQSADRARLAELLEQGGAQSVEDLVAAEGRSADARGLDEALGRARGQVVSVGGATDLASLRADVSGLDPDALPGEADRLTEQIEALRAQHSAAAQAVGAQLEIIKGLDRGAQAAEAAELAENELASVRELTLSFARQHLAAHLLEREIQRYRQANQGPLLERAGELFRRLTDEHFCNLTVAFDEDARPSLVCLRADEREVKPERLSDGEADQLYLALRVASLERHLERNTALPFVADDLFVTFDDDRARAGLEVLAELAQETLGAERVELFEL